MIFVILNMLIAIISDTYSQCRTEMLQKEPVSLSQEITEYVPEYLHLKQLTIIIIQTKSATWNLQPSYEPATTTTPRELTRTRPHSPAGMCCRRSWRR